MVYEIRLRGRAERTIAAAFDDCDVSTTADHTVLRADVPDQPALYAVLERIQSLGLELIDLHRDHGADGPGPGTPDPGEPTRAPRSDNEMD